MASSLQHSHNPFDDATFSVAVDFPARAVEVHGDLDLATAPHLQAAIEPLLISGGIVTLDLAGLKFLDASGLRVFEQINQALAEHGHHLVFRNLNARQRRIFLAAGLSSMLVTA